MSKSEEDKFRNLLGSTEPTRDELIAKFKELCQSANSGMSEGMEILLRLHRESRVAVEEIPDLLIPFSEVHETMRLLRSIYQNQLIHVVAEYQNQERKKEKEGG